jgi:KaiC/GvpD/RAD55 family RecA-like ATPase
VAVKGKGKAEPQVCTVCGGEVNAEGECTVCGNKQAANSSANQATANAAPELTKDQAVKIFKQIEGIGDSRANALYESGFTSLESFRDTSVQDIIELAGLDEKLAKAVHDGAEKMLASSSQQPTGNNDALYKWLSGENGEGGLSAWLGTSPEASKPAQALKDTNVDALKKWLSGEEDALQQWLGFDTTPQVVVEGDALKRLRELERQLDEKDLQVGEREREIESMRVEIDELKDGLQRQLSAYKDGTFDPVKFIEEQAELNKQLQTEISRRKQLEDEMEHLKKGSIAVIKYVKSQQQRGGTSPEMKKRLAEESMRRQQMETEVGRLTHLQEELKKQLDGGLQKLKPDERVLKEKELTLIEKEALLKAKEEQLSAYEEAAKRGEIDLGGASEELRQRLQEELRDKEEEFRRRDEELSKKVILLEEEVSKYRIDEKLRKEAQELKGKPKDVIDQVFAKKEIELLSKEKSILIREQEIQRLKEELQLKEDEMKKLTEPLKYKEEEMLRREEDLLYRERLMQAQLRKLEEAKAQGGSTEELELKDRLEQLKSEIATKEEEVRAKEKYLKQKMEELRLREQGLIEEEIDARGEDRTMEFKQEKAKTGSPRLDDLLLGGIPFGSNVSIYGPAYVGKEVIVNAFMAEGLKKGIPVIWVITDKTPADIREEMQFILPGYAEYEKLGLAKYVDAYSRSMGSETQDAFSTYINDATDHESILKAVDDIAKEFKKKNEYYRLAFRSISTLIAYLDPTTTFKFLQPFAGRRKRDKAISFYVIEKGMHEEQEIQMLGSVMDGALEFKVEQLKSYLAVKGICDVQSRAWIRYTYSKQGVSIGSFSLDHIK